MLKISQLGTANHTVTLKLEGRIVGPWVGELRGICEPLLDAERAVRLDLGEVSFVDGEGVAVLNGLKSRGVELKNCSPFVEQQMNTAG